ncbi:hypothetical protein [Spongorhabdus nitratireducens]
MVICRQMLALAMMLLAQHIMAGSSETGYRVAIVDRFFPPVAGFTDDQQRDQHSWLYGLLDLDSDDRQEPFYHGDLVRLIAAHPGITFINYPITDDRKPMDSILLNLQKIHTRLAVQPVDALILSWESSTLISAFEQPLYPEKAEIYKQQIQQWGQQYPVWNSTYRIIRMLEALVAEGVAVYTIAGNGGRRMVNTFSFAEGVTTVGASESELSHYIADNPFVDIYAQAAYQLQRIDNQNGKPAGYDIDGDGCVDIPLQRLTSEGQQAEDLPRQFWKLLKGSSFAAPRALKQALFADLSLPACEIP